MEFTLASKIFDTAVNGGPHQGIHFFVGGKSEYRFVRYRDFWRLSHAFGTGYSQPRAGRRKLVLIATQKPFATLVAFVGALAHGALPVVLPGPKALGGWDATAKRLNAWIRRCGRDCCVVLDEGTPALAIDEVETHYVGEIPDQCGTGGDLREPVPGRSDDIAFLQLTSASTADSKLVAVKNGNVCANLAAINAGVDGREEKVANWLPLYHDMGLIGVVLYSLFHGYPLYTMSPTDFLKKPLRWIEALGKYGCTLTAAPNFGYEYAAQHVADEDVQGLDLSGVKMALIGAEPIRYPTVVQFLQRFSAIGLRPESIIPSYGLAEATVCATLSSYKLQPQITWVELSGLQTGAGLTLSKPKDMLDGDGKTETMDRIGLFSVGKAVQGVELELVDEEGNVIFLDGQLGEFKLRGPCITSGYFDPEVQRIDQVHSHGFLTGDLGFILNGEIYILERKKNLIIRNGQNFYASLLEKGVAALLDTSHENVVILETSVHEPNSKIVALVENMKGDLAALDHIIHSVRKMELRIDEIMLFRKRVVPRTTSGKKRYFECRQQLSRNGFAPDSVLNPFAS